MGLTDKLIFTMGAELSEMRLPTIMQENKVEWSLYYLARVWPGLWPGLLLYDSSQ